VSERRACPEPATIAAFIDGTLAGDQTQSMSEHIASCDECLAEIGDAMPFVREERESATHRSRAWSLGIAAAVAIVVIGGATFVVKEGGFDAMRYRAAIRPLVTAASTTERTIEPRLAGFQWTAMQRTMRGNGASDSARLRVEGAAGDVLQSSRNPHATGVARLVIGESSDAIAALNAALQMRPRDAVLLSDLAAAYYVDAVRSGHAAELAQALAVADRALALNDRLAEARFNRALILEKLGQRRQAAAAWNDYLSIDPKSPWAAEARERLERRAR